MFFLRRRCCVLFLDSKVCWGGFFTFFVIIKEHHLVFCCVFVYSPLSLSLFLSFSLSFSLFFSLSTNLCLFFLTPSRNSGGGGEGKKIKKKGQKNLPLSSLFFSIAERESAPAPRELAVGFLRRRRRRRRDRLLLDRPLFFSSSFFCTPPRELILAFKPTMYKEQTTLCVVYKLPRM